MKKIIESFIEVPDDSPNKFLNPPEGLDGYWWETNKQICVPFIASHNEGDGTFTKWLKELEGKNKIIFFPTIISARLNSILRKRGYKDAGVNDKDMGFVDGLAWCPLPSKEKETEK
jgi:hypothetical protein